MADIKPLKVGPNGLISEFETGDTIAASIAPGSGGGGGAPVVIRPATLSGNQNDYAPTDWETATHALLTADATIRTITGLSSTGVDDGEAKVIVNSGTTPLVLVPEHPDSTAANRLTGSRFFVIAPKKAVTVVYDATLARWHCVGEWNPNNAKGWESTIFASSATAGDHGMWGFSAGSLGTLGAATLPMPQPGYYNMQTSTSSTGVGFFFNKTLQLGLFNEGASWAQGFLNIPRLSNAADRFVFSIVFAATSVPAETAVNQLGMRYSHDINSGNFELFCYNAAGTLYTLDTGVTAVINTLYVMRIEKNRDGSEVYGYINDVFVGCLQIAVPPTGAFFFNVGLRKTAGVTNTAIRLHSFTIGSIWP